VNKIIDTKDTNFKFKRVYIRKGEKDWRPLGVPEYFWRIYLQLIHNFLYIFVEDYFLEDPHGFIPGKGTLTAWTRVLEITENYKYVYEFDLKQCFPSINLGEVSMLMMKLKYLLPW
jgi:RNA-directed DNA polymerase